MYVSEICAEGIFATFPWWLKNVKIGQKYPFFQMISKKENNYVFSEVKYLNYTKSPNFACDFS